MNRAEKSLLPVIALVFLFAACGTDKPFDSAAWLNGDMRARGRMCEDLVNGKILVGQTAQSLLGQADKVYASTLSYKIDMGLPFKDPTPYALLVSLDENRRVREVRIVD